MYIFIYLDILIFHIYTQIYAHTDPSKLIYMYLYIYIYTRMHIDTYKNNTHTCIYIYFYLTPDFMFVSVWNAYKRDHICNQAAI